MHWYFSECITKLIIFKCDRLLRSQVKQQPNPTPKAIENNNTHYPPPNCILSYNLINLYIPFLIPIKKPQNQVGCEQPTAFTIFG
ncbi:MAG: hypothetical protein EWV48_21980 [Microcystis aeruginosa Ma_QC_C_20070823_S13]|nr:MAG: hypothetical protein EWV48_21980 [Microcystis aeruginosa Ma_QC_C_20070823_S13]TRU61006.1 MAG: hypothetical protein EWV56_09960 [Microcystis aeruginosa Ma_QC_C_20070823_S13D]